MHLGPTRSNSPDIQVEVPRHLTPSIGVEVLIEVKKTLLPSAGSNPVCVIGGLKKSSSVIGKSLEYFPPQPILLTQQIIKLLTNLCSC